MIDNKNIISERLNLAEYKHKLYSVMDFYTDRRLEYYKIQAQAVKANYFYCFDSLIENQPIPFIYVYDQRLGSHNRTLDLVEVNKQLWTLGEIALAIVVYDFEIKIIDTRKPIISNTEPAYLEGLTESIQKIDDNLKYRLFEGRILEESPADYVSVSPYQKLLDHIEKEVLNKSQQIRCSQYLLRKLLVKFILIKYLEEQTDNNNDSVFEDGFFNQFVTDKKYKSFFDNQNYTFCDVLRSRGVIELFKFLNKKFNGGIFKISSDEEIKIQNADFNIIANALDGDKDINGQMSIWRYYDFNLLPIEFISRLYESFVISIDGKQKSTGAYYTPPHLARLLIDELLPFDKDVDFENFKILDPSCGSGIFLVLAYKRMITLWMLSNKKQVIAGRKDIKAIKKILLDCIYGVDINEDALSITATSLQIELSSHIKPKEIWADLTFDNLEGEGNLTNIGFFKWYKTNLPTFDIIVGNPPFNIAPKEHAKNIELGIDDDFSQEKYQDYNGKLQSFPNNNPALIFLNRSIDHLLKPYTGLMFMVMPASTFLYTTKSFEYKKSLVLTCNIERIYDFTPLREHLWGKTKVATVAVKLTNKKNQEKQNIEHFIVRNSSANEKGSIRFQIDKYDRFNVPIDFVFTKEYIWKTNLLGGGRLRHFVENFTQYRTISDYFKNNSMVANIGYTRDQSVINNLEKRAKGEQVINLNGLEVLDSNFFSMDTLSEDSVKKILVDDWVRIPKNGFAPPNIIIRLNINVALPIVYNTRKLTMPNGILTIKGEDREKMQHFVSVFKENRDLYIFMIQALSPKVLIQQGGGYTVNRQDILNLPLSLDESGRPEVFNSINHFDRIVIDDTKIIVEGLNKINSEIFNKINSEILNQYSESFCEIMNFVYEKRGYKFKQVRNIINDDYVWVTFEHTDKTPIVEELLSINNKEIYTKILSENIINSALTINRIITHYEENNRISFIKPNKLKYWMRTIAYRDAENVKGEMFKNGY